MNRTTIALLGAVLSGICVAGPLEAQRIDSPYRFVLHSQMVNVYAGHLSTSAAEIDLGPQSGPTIGGRYSIRLGGAFDGEADLSLTPTNRLVTDTLVVQGERRVLGEASSAL